MAISAAAAPNAANATNAVAKRRTARQKSASAKARKRRGSGKAAPGPRPASDKFLAKDAPAPAVPPPTGFTPPQLAALYNFPKAATGAGETIALIETGGGFDQKSLDMYFAKLGLPSPKVTVVSVGGGGNHPTGDASDADMEVTGDIEIVASAAPGAKIVVYFAPGNMPDDVMQAIEAAILDQENKVTIMPLSLGSREDGWTQQAMAGYDRVFQIAEKQGITVLVASGDDGSSDGEPNGRNAVDFPQSSPHVLSVGGTAITVTDGVITDETGWFDKPHGSGGGQSSYFPVLPEQRGLHLTLTGGGKKPLTHRGVPDVAAVATNSYNLLVDGKEETRGGASYSVQLWAALVARLRELNGNQPIPNFRQLLYEHPEVLRDITTGNNGAYAAGPGWDPVTGLGSPNGQAIADLILKNQVPKK
jgi:kumamolisin